MRKTKKSNPNLVIIVDGLNDLRLSVFFNESNKLVGRLNNSLVHKKNSLIVYNNELHTPYDSPGFIAGECVSFYDTVVSCLGMYKEHILGSNTIIHLICNTEDYLDSDNKAKLQKLSSVTEKAEVIFWTNLSSNSLKAIDFGVVAKVYSPMTAGVQTMFSRMYEETTNFFERKKV